jgi:hypothetical protein
MFKAIYIYIYIKKTALLLCNRKTLLPRIRIQPPRKGKAQKMFLKIVNKKSENKLLWDYLLNRHTGDTINATHFLHSFSLEKQNQSNWSWIPYGQ